ncbi:hypothetical protein, partial [Paenibacillus sp. Y412MC10]|uniref:hypothetical protein n=1 Tax=Geobacillus sp. (strain Y412MC10) TaxID=481743 RepID=UPI0016433C4E
ETDGWLVGYRPELWRGVWVGYEKGGEMRKVDGGGGAAIFGEYREKGVEKVGAKIFGMGDEVVRG